MKTAGFKLKIQVLGVFCFVFGEIIDFFLIWFFFINHGKINPPPAQIFHPQDGDCLLTLYALSMWNSLPSSQLLSHFLLLNLPFLDSHYTVFCDVVGCVLKTLLQPALTAPTLPCMCCFCVLEIQLLFLNSVHFRHVLCSYANGLFAIVNQRSWQLAEQLVCWGCCLLC